jgi:eukaryotic-like serine/threonine-protein kinase
MGVGRGKRFPPLDESLVEPSTPPAQHPAMLLPGAVVGRWRVETWGGRGVYGVVYRAVPVDEEHPYPVALKLALNPGDPRFPREVELLSRTHHPSIPRVYGHGQWQASDGQRYPFIAMEWIDGAPLYDHASVSPPSPPQVALWMAQLAGALQALHSVGGVHRDVKGDNVLVRRSDGRAFLTDFGTGLYPGAPTLTPPLFFPGTPVYQSPEAALFELRFFRERSARYCARPADDLYALGVTACKLLTGAYPEFSQPYQDEHGRWKLEAVLPPPTLLHGSGVEPRLRALILRLLSVHPEERGTAGQLSEAFEQAAAPTSPLPSAPEAQSSAQEPSAERGPAEPFRRRTAASSWLALAAVLLLAVWARWADSAHPGEGPSCARAEPTSAGKPDTDPVGLGEAAAAALMESAPLPPPGQVIMAEDTPPEPVPGQMRPDAKGRCPLKRHVVLNGGCWGTLNLDRETCEGFGGYFFKSTCYLPIIPRPRPPTSSPPDKR